MVPNVTFLLLNAVFGHRFASRPRILVALVFVILLFVLTAVLAAVDTDTFQREFYVITIVSIVLINVNSAIFQV